ncbi:MAG: tRNA (adenosine(37)-N6)-threonylcarbamoyltransferase complex ATPase subunit type 1 TsaE [Treponema sp.]|jgi:tRNA threonylcarbamoyladenosine biosynthesis protein TsaE|nr:tRNA (adenosine(37)-N6)-threonylcarbamoyltransferase complex ATPase subunit type 1 TsaE [Treponema sp.]
MKTVDSPAEGLSFSAEETLSLGEALGRSLKPGDVVALKGSLGAGKTCFAKGIALGLGVREEVTSPSYTIISEYEGNCPFRHADLYRLKGIDEFALLGADELFDGSGVSVIEWPEKIPGALPPDSFLVEISIGEDGRRLIRQSGGPPK